MIYGDPFNFALQFDKVQSWNTPNNRWENGLFYFYLNGKNIFNLVDVFELRTVYYFYQGTIMEAAIPVDHSIKDEELRQHVCDYFWNREENLMNNILDFTCTPMKDNGFFMYFYKREKNDVFIWSKNEGKTIHQTLLAPGTVQSVMNQLL